MKRALILFLILFASVWLGLQISSDPGYVLFNYKKLAIEMPLWLVGLGLIVTIVISYFLIRFFSHASSLKKRMKKWRKKRKQQLARSWSQQGLVQLMDGQWQQAEATLLTTLEHHDKPLMNYLALATAAQQQNAFEKRDRYLNQAIRNTPHLKNSINLAKIRLQLLSNQYEEALKGLKNLHNLMPQQRLVMKLLFQTYQQQAQWQAIIDLLPSLRKYKVVSTQDLEHAAQQAYAGLLTSALHPVEEPAENTKKTTRKFWQKSQDELEKTWDALPRHLRDDPLLISIYVKGLRERNAITTAETVLAQRLQKTWDDTLVRLYGELPSENAAKQLATAEQWLIEHPKNASLLLALGQICLRNKLWGKARTYLENSLSEQANLQAYHALAQLLLQLGDHEMAMEYYQQALAHAVKV
jgi:HemY protein